MLDAAMTGVRLGDGTTWVKHRGYSWVLGAHMAAKLYPAGQGTPAYYQSRRPAEPHAGSTICLDKTYLLDTGALPGAALCAPHTACTAHRRHCGCCCCCAGVLAAQACLLGWAAPTLSCGSVSRACRWPPGLPCARAPPHTCSPSLLPTHARV